MSPRVLSIVMPAFNEERTVLKILERVDAVVLDGGLGKEVVFVDDCSRDQTFEMAEQARAQFPDLNLRIVRHPRNRGKGAAIHTGIEHATGDFLIVQDADLEYDPQEYNRILGPMLADVADVVYGSRFVSGQPHRVLFFWHSIGNRVLTTLSNAFTNLNLTDMETCYKCFRTEIIKRIKLDEQRFGFEPEVTAKIARVRGIRIYEVGISYYGRTYDEGKKIGWRDGARAIYVILKYGLR